MSEVVIFRADGHARMGLGHLYRCLALAEMINERYSCYLATRAYPRELEATLNDEFDRIYPLDDVPLTQETTYLLNLIQGIDEARTKPVVVLDGYHFTTPYQQVLKADGCSVICIDDIHAYPFVADVVINHAGGVKPSDYVAESYTRFLLGPTYALLRKPFREVLSKQELTTDSEEGAFVCLGGADPPNATLEVISRLADYVPTERINVVVGDANPHYPSLKSFAASVNTPIVLYRGLNAREMARLMRRSPYGVTSPSTVSFEYLSVGKLLYLVPIADNQRRIYDYYIREGLALPFASFPLTDAEAVVRMLKKSRRVFDAQNIKDRYLQLFKTLSHEADLASKR